MSNYINNNLGKNEKVICQAKYNSWCIIPNIIGAIISVVIAFVSINLLTKLNDYMVNLGEEAMPDIIMKSLIFMIIAFTAISFIINLFKIFSVRGMELAVTNKRIIGKVGFFSIKALDYPIEKIDNVSISASFWGRIFKYYNLSIKSTNSEISKNGTPGGINFVGVVNAIEFKNYVTAAIEQHADEARKLQAEEIAKAMKK